MSHLFTSTGDESEEIFEGDVHGGVQLIMGVDKKNGWLIQLIPWKIRPSKMDETG